MNNWRQFYPETANISPGEKLCQGLRGKKKCQRMQKIMHDKQIKMLWLGIFKTIREEGHLMTSRPSDDILPLPARQPAASWQLSSYLVLLLLFWLFFAELSNFCFISWDWEALSVELDRQKFGKSKTNVRDRKRLEFFCHSDFALL